MRRISALALAAAACSSPTIGPSFDLKTPVSMAAFAGYTRYDAFLHTYVAVASMQGDELRVFDPLENRAVSSPGFAFPLSVPTDPRPVLLASASLNDVDPNNGNAPLPDLLVVASAGQQQLQVVDTWGGADPTTGQIYVLAQRIDLSKVADPGTEILAMTGLPSFQPGTAQVAPGMARILVAFSKPAGGSTAKLVTVEFQRTLGLERIDAPNATIRATSVGFEAVSLARVVENTMLLGAPATAKFPHLVFAATPDIVTGTDGRSATGVAMLDASGSDPSTWTVTAVDAMAPTRLVAAAYVAERYPDDQRQFTANTQYRSFRVPAVRVYADLDPAVCGPSGPIACGIATLDPLANPPGLTGDIVATGPSGPVPVPNQAYRAPVSLPGTPIAMAVAMPAAAGTLAATGTTGQRCDPPYTACSSPTATYQTDDGAQPLMLFAPLSGQLWSTAALVVATSSGTSYVVDLGGSAPPDDTSLLVSETTRVQATSGLVTMPAGTTFPNPPTTATPVLGLWDSQGTPTDTSTDPTVIDRSIQVTPGFTTDASWIVSWQGTIPAFEGRPAVVGRSGGGVYVAFETPLSDGTWFSDTSLGDPVRGGPLGIHARDPANPAQEPGDIVEVYDLKGNLFPCADSSGNAVQQSTPVLGFLSPAPLPPQDPASIPGGALSLGPTVPGCIDPSNQPNLIPAAGGGTYPAYRALVAVRAFGLVLRGSHVGYAGRPILDAGGPTGPQPPSALAWEDEGPLAAACAGGDRLACERLSLARKARRFYYTLESPCPRETPTCHVSASLADPLAPGPVLAFRIGPNPASAPAANLVRGMALSFSTLSGVAPMARQPIVRSVPTAAIALDRSIPPLNPNLKAYPEQGDWFYVTHTGGAVLGFGPGMSVGAAVTLQ